MTVTFPPDFAKFRKCFGCKPTLQSIWMVKIFFLQSVDAIRVLVLSPSLFLTFSHLSLSLCLCSALAFSFQRSVSLSVVFVSLSPPCLSLSSLFVSLLFFLSLSSPSFSSFLSSLSLFIIMCTLSQYVDIRRLSSPACSTKEGVSTFSIRTIERSNNPPGSTIDRCVTDAVCLLSFFFCLYVMVCIQMHCVVLFVYYPLLVTFVAC